MHFLKVHILENLFPKNHEDLSSRTNLATIDSALSKTLHFIFSIFTRDYLETFFFKKCGCGEHSFSGTVNPISLNFGRLTYNTNSLWVNKGFLNFKQKFFFCCKTRKLRRSKIKLFRKTITIVVKKLILQNPSYTQSVNIQTTVFFCFVYSR